MDNLIVAQGKLHIHLVKKMSILHETLIPIILKVKT